MSAKPPVTIISGEYVTTDGGYAPAPYRITVNERDLSAREVRAVGCHAQIPEGSHVLVTTDLFGANAATIGQMISVHQLLPEIIEPTIRTTQDIRIQKMTTDRRAES